jgi:hypothetical protein
MGGTGVGSFEDGGFIMRVCSFWRTLERVIDLYFDILVPWSSTFRLGSLIFRCPMVEEDSTAGCCNAITRVKSDKQWMNNGRDHNPTISRTPPRSLSPFDTAPTLILVYNQRYNGMAMGASWHVFLIN